MNADLGYTVMSDRFGFRALGSFRCRRKNETMILAVTAALYTLCAVITIVNAVMVLSGDLSMPIFDYDKTVDDFAPTLDLLCVITSVIILLIFSAVAVAVVIIVIGGEEYSFKANELKMLITAPDGSVTELPYCDIVEVSYEPLTLFSNRPRGFDVYISTKYRTIRYQYIYSKNKLLREEKHTPFFILEEQAGLKTRRYTDEMGV